MYVFLEERKLLLPVQSAKFNNSVYREEEELENNMFPFCLINASVTDAEGITSRLVSFPLSLFASATLLFQWSF